MLSKQRINMQISYVTYLLRVFVLAVTCVISFPSIAQIPGIDLQNTEQSIDISEVPKAEVEGYLATLTDSETRLLLLKQLKEKSQEEEASMMRDSYVSHVIMALQNGSERFETEFANIVKASRHYGESLRNTADILFNVRGYNAISNSMVTLQLLLLGGAAVVLLVFRLQHGFRSELKKNGRYTVYSRLVRAGAGLLHDGLKIGLFIGVTVPLTFLFFEKFDPLRVLASTTLILIASIWGVHAILKEMLFSPVCKNLFIVGRESCLIYYWSAMGFFVPSLLSLLSSGLLALLNFPSELIRFNNIILAALSMISLIIGVFFHYRLSVQSHQKPVIRSRGVSIFSKRWYWPVVTILTLLYLVGSYNIVIGDIPRGRYNYFAVLLLIISPMYVRFVQVVMSSRPIEEIMQSDAADINMEKEEAGTDAMNSESNLLVRILFLVPYFTIIVLFFLEGTGFGIMSWLDDGSGTSLWQSLTNSLVAVVMGLVFWNIVRGYINKKMPEISLDPEALMESEGGGSEAATRTQTVLPILRNFILFLIVVTVLLIVLSSIGVNTGPLLAGAGVFGIALGFGAQKLVQDVVSGIFFLFEDAFRIGEYIEAGDMRGTVESTSIRSLKLRHHLGPVQTIPYSEIRAVRNHSRDFVIMKLKFRIPFDTDLEVVRKTIKKVGLAMLDDEELGADFIAPLKSQGVQTVEDDALMMRMKFTAKPGKQWMIRREAYRLVKEALAAKGINFAVRQVTVHIPDKENIDPAQLPGIAGSAASAAENTRDKNLKAIDPMADM